MQAALRKIPFCCRRDSDERQPLYCVGKSPPRYMGKALAKAPLPQAALCKGFVIAGAETPRKAAAPVERGPREW